MKKRQIVVTCHTDATGEYCYVTCPFSAGYWCDAYGEKTAGVPGVTGSRFRCRKCKEEELRE